MAEEKFKQLLKLIGGQLNLWESIHDSPQQHQVYVDNFNQLTEEISVITAFYKSRHAKSLKRANFFLELATRLEKRGTEKRTKCLHFYKKALVNVSSQQECFERGAVFICLKIALMLRCSGNHLPALASVNQAIELTSDNKSRDYFALMLQLKIELQIKLQLFNEAHQTLRLLQESMTDSGHANQGVVDHYDRIFASRPSQLSQETDSSEGEESDLLELDSNCQIENGGVIKGRFLRATNYLPYGMFLLKERVVNTVYYLEYLKSRCLTCHNAIDQIFFPCRNCTQVRFCSVNCEDIAWSQGMHRFDCRIIDLMEDNSVAWHTFQLISALGLENAVKFYKNSKPNSFTIEEYLKKDRLCREQFWEMDKENQLRTFALIDSFVDHSEFADTTTNREYLSWAVLVVILINQEQHYFDTIQTNYFLPNDFALLTKKVAILMRKIRYNSFAWTDLDARDINNYHMIANCLGLVSSFINHSCDSNAFWEICNGTLNISTMCRIDAQQEVTISYGPSTFDSLRRRQERLEKFNFVCACSSCMQDIRKWLCLSCAHCKGPIYEWKFKREQSTNCMLCSKPYHEYRTQMKKVTSARLQLAFLIRFKAYNFDSQKVLELANQLMARVYAYCAPLVECIVAVCEHLIERNLVQEATQLMANYSNISLQDESHNELNESFDDFLKRVQFQTKLVTIAISCTKLSKAFCAESLFTVIEGSRNLQLWKDLHIASKSNQSLNLIIELLENSLFTQ